MILDLPKLNDEETVVEDFIELSTYCDAVNTELARSGCTEEISESELDCRNRPWALKQWCNNKGVRVPGKRAVAYHIVDNIQENGILDASYADQLRELHQSILRALKL